MTQPDSAPLAGRTAVVTGATSGIGAATARALAAAGAAVALAGRRADRLDALAAELGDGALPVPADLADPQQAERLAATVRERLGAPDLVVANAGVMLGAPFEEADTREWDRMLDVNVAGLLRTSRAFAGELLAAAEAGRPADLVLVGSVGGHQAFPAYAVYCATKAAVAHLARTLRAELGPRGLRVKNVEPGVVRTELGDGMGHDATRAGLEDWRAALTPLAPEDIARSIVFATSLPANVNVAELIVLPTAQG